VTREDKKRKKKHTVVLEKSSQPKNTSKGEHGEIKERVKESNESSPKFSENASAGYYQVHKSKIINTHICLHAH
jgi:phage tail tape-measure protein